MVEVVLISFASPKLHICNFKITPEMTCAIPVRLFVVLWSRLAVGEPLYRIVVVQILWMRGKEFGRLWPEGRYRFWCIIKVYVESISLVVVLHISEDVIVDVAIELHFGFNAPIVSYILQGGMVVEQTTVPATHLMVRFQC